MADIKKIKLGDVTYNLRDADAARLTDTTITSDVTTTVSVGGISKGTSLKDKSVAEVIESIFTASGTVASAIDIEGGYFSVTSLNDIPDHAKVLGALCYVTGTAEEPINKFYQYNGEDWIEKEFGVTTEATTSAAGLMSAADKTKLAGIASGAEINVQADWNETNTSSDAYIKNKPALKTVATSGSYNDLTNKPTIPTVNNATLTIQKNGTTVATFTANSSTNQTANIAVPTGAAADKGVDTSISAASTSANLPTSAAVAAFVEGKGYKTYTAATSSKDGLMSKTDKANLDTIVNSFNSDDSNTTIDTVKEVLKAFENAPEGTNIANALAAKQDEITTTNKLNADKIDGLAAVATSGSYNDLSDKPNNVVTTDTAQTISGNKTFSSNVQFGSQDIDATTPPVVVNSTYGYIALGEVDLNSYATKLTFSERGANVDYFGKYIKYPSYNYTLNLPDPQSSETHTLATQEWAQANFSNNSTIDQEFFNSLYK